MRDSKNMVELMDYRFLWGQRSFGIKVRGSKLERGND